MILAFALFATALMPWPAVSAGGAVSWGTADDGMRLGIALQRAASPSDSALRVLLHNTGATTRDIVVGSDRGSGPLYSFELTAAAPDGARQKVFDFRVLSAPMSGFVQPVTIRLEPGESREFLFPLRLLLCVENRREVKLNVLLERGYSIRASFPPGRLLSPEVSFPRAQR